MWDNKILKRKDIITALSVDPSSVSGWKRATNINVRHKETIILTAVEKGIIEIIDEIPLDPALTVQESSLPPLEIGPLADKTGVGQLDMTGLGGGGQIGEIEGCTIKNAPVTTKWGGEVDDILAIMKQMHESEENALMQNNKAQRATLKASQETSKHKYLRRELIKKQSDMKDFVQLKELNG